LTRTVNAGTFGPSRQPSISASTRGLGELLTPASALGVFFN
jgi:hypothetical protein